jgi:glycosidase
MPSSPRFPSLYQINTRIWLRELSRNAKRGVTFDEISDSYLDSLAFLGFDWLWPFGVWQIGELGRQVSRGNPEWMAGYRQSLPDLTDDDITGSPFAIKSYSVNKDFGGDEALARFRERLRQRGMKLLLDFVPNHTALDHPWVFEHPEYFIGGSDDDLVREPHNFRRAETKFGTRVIAYGRDPYFPGWPDTFQLNYRSNGLRQAMLNVLEGIAGKCDGIRCDMAMLPLPDVIQRTWGDRSLPADGSPPVDSSFWLEAVHVRNKHPEFVFMAEVYWDREFDLQQQGFDYTYDKRLYDRLRSRHAAEVRTHLCADPEFQRKSVRFLENHDEPRAAEIFPPDVHRAAGVIAFLVPGMRFFHEGEFEGRKQHISMHLGRRPIEPVDAEIRSFYLQLLNVLKSPLLRGGVWRLLECRSAWDDNPTAGQFVVFSWQMEGTPTLLAVVNFGELRGQCYVPLPWPEISGLRIDLRDRLSNVSYERDGDQLRQQGLFLDLPPWGHQVFEVKVKKHC